MLWLTILLFSLLSSIFHKFERSIGLVSFIGMGYLVGTPNYQYNGDAVVYLNNYFFKTENFERGYNWLTDLSSNYYDYQSFRLYSSIFVYIVLFIIILLLTKRVATIALFCSIAMFPFDSLQVRNGMATLFVLLGYWMLIKFGNKGVIPSLIVIYLGSWFHSLALIFLILPIIWLFRVKVQKHFKLYFTFGSVLALIIELVGASRLVPLIAELVDRFSSRTDASINILTVYNSGTTDVRIWLVLFFISLLIAVTGYNFRDYIDNSTQKYYQLFLCSMLLWIPGLILLTISVDYLRVLRVIVYFYFILIVNLISQVKVSSRLKLFSYGLCISILLMLSQVWVYGLTFEEVRSIIHLI